MVKRRYESVRRQELARQTRRVILDAAATLFVNPGYAATPLTAVADHAGVPIQTVYKVFGSKKALLTALVDGTTPGDDPIAEPLAPPSAHRGPAETLDDLLAAYAAHLAGIYARQAQIMLALAAAAATDPEAADIWRVHLADRRRALTAFAADLLATGELRAELTAETVTDVLWRAMDVHHFDAVVRGQGWPLPRFHRWYVDTVTAALTR